MLTAAEIMTHVAIKHGIHVDALKRHAVGRRRVATARMDAIERLMLGGFSNIQIADWLGIKPASVAVTVSKMGGRP